MENNTKILNKQIQQSIVKIRSECSSFNWYQPHKTLDDYKSVGTGFFIDQEGTILTCCHVIENSVKIWIIIPSEGRDKIEAEVISICPTNDLALLKIKNYKNKSFLKLGDSDKIIQQDKVFAGGYPLSSDKLKFSSGIISGLQGIFLQTDAPINEGNSGGPLIKYCDNDCELEVIGINSSKVKSSLADNIGYAVPINLFKIIKESMFINKIILKPELLVWFNNSTDHTLEYIESPTDEDCTKGYFISHIDSKSPLFRAGIRNNDILCSFDGCKIDNFGECNIKGIDDKIHISDLVQRYVLNQNVKIVYWDTKNKKVNNVNVSLDVGNDIFKIRKKYFGFENIDYEIIAGLIIMELGIDHLENIKESGLDFNKSVKLMNYHKRKNRFESVLFITNIFQGSFINSTDNLDSGSIINKINNKTVSTLKQFREAFLDPVIINGKKYFVLESDNYEKIIIELNKIKEEEKFLSERFNYKLSNLLNLSIENNENRYFIK